ncbi:uncharacterized protein LOC142342844 isoform X1 [Convolutriloba macropyga]|uniref:uncharacterized protein LOC142342844 isoform X1 n=1 Tax=Convolutriloba macropyga TaxID=536237 RepID=UPI003F525F96
MRQRKLVEVTEDNLEDLLACDDIFLDYFNVFLAASAFSIPLRFDRLTGTLVRIRQDEYLSSTQEAGIELGDTKSVATRAPPVHPQYGVNEEQREAILKWVKNERLVFFLQTRLYLEYKLCRYLVRPLRPMISSAKRSDSRSGSKSNPRFSARLGGVSRTDDVSSADSLAGNKSYNSNNSYEYDNVYAQLQAGFRYLRPGSRAFSLPVYLTHLRHSLATASIALPKPAGNIVVHAIEKEKTQFLGVSENNGSSNESNGKQVSSNYLSSDKQKSTNHIHPSLNGTSDSSDTLAKKNAAILNKENTDLEKENCENIEEDQHFEGEDNLNGDENELEFEENDERLSCIQFEEVNAHENHELVKDQAESNDGSNNKNSNGGFQETINSLQESKEILFKNREMMKLFTKFLKGTQGETLMNFWIDCEQFRDDMTQFEELETHEIQSKIYLHAFRELLDKYGLKLTNETKAQLINERSDSFSSSIFSKVQYDALKRLRSYWVPRFVIYCQTKEGSYANQTLERSGLEITSIEKPEKKLSPTGFETLVTFDFLPSLNVARTLSVQPDVSWSDVSNPMIPWIKVMESGKGPDARIKSAKRDSKLKTSPSAHNFVSDIDRVSFVDKDSEVSLVMGEDLIKLDEVTMCIVKDKDSGGPFQRYLQQMCLSSEYVEQTLTSLAQYLYWQDMLELMEAEQRVGDRLIRLTNAWGIFNKYFNTASLWAVTRDIGQIEQLRGSLEQCANSRDVNGKCSHVFKTITQHILTQLKSQWINYAVKDSETLESSLDFELFLSNSEDTGGVAGKGASKTAMSDMDSQRDERFRSRGVSISNQKSSMTSLNKGAAGIVGEEASLHEKQLRLQKAFQIAQDIEHYRKKQKNYRNQAHRRKKQNKQQKKTVVVEKSIHTDTLANEKAKNEETKEKKRKSDKPAEVKVLSSVKDFLNPEWQGLSRNFVKYCESYEEFNTLLLFRLFLEIQKYNKLIHQSAKVKDVQSQLIYTTYLDAYAPLRVNLPKKYLVKEKLTAERMKSLEDYIEKTLRTAVKIFNEGQKWTESQTKAKKTSLIPGKLTSGVQTADVGIPPMWVRRRVENGLPSKSAAQAGIRSIPTEKDRETFSRVLSKETTLKECRDIIAQFHEYLNQHGADQELPYIANSLKFYIEVYKLTQFIHQDQHDDVLLSRKLDGIVNIYVDSQTSDARVQIETSTEQAAKIVRQSHSFIRGPPPSCKTQPKGHSLDEVSEFVQAADVIKEQLLQFWSAFWKKRQEVKSQKRAGQTQDRGLIDKMGDVGIDILESGNSSEETAEEFQILFEMPKQKPVGNQFGSSVSFTLLEGVKWKGFTMDESSSRDNLDMFGGGTGSQGALGSAAPLAQHTEQQISMSHI